MAWIARSHVVAWMLLALAPFQGGCVATLNHLAANPDVRVTRNLAFGDDARQQLDVYQPLNVSPARRARVDPLNKGLPLVVFLYGGSWQDGSKDDYAFVAMVLAEKGYVTVVPDYRIYPQARYPAFIEDAASAVAWAHAHSAQWGADPHRLVIVGHSAGAYLAAMLAVDPRWLNRVGLQPASDLTAVVGLAGPYDFLPLRDPALKAIFGPVDDAAHMRDTQPISHVTGVAPPMLLLAGANDKIVDPGNTRRMAEAIRAHGGNVQSTIYKSSSHKIMIGAFAPSLRFLSHSFDDTIRFIDEEVSR